MKQWLLAALLVCALGSGAAQAQTPKYQLPNTNGSIGAGAVTAPLCWNGDSPATYSPCTTANPAPVAANPSTITWTQTLVTLTAATSSTLIAANANRKALRWMVTGVNPMTVAPGTGAVTAGNGMNYAGAASAGGQGASTDFTGEVSTQAFSAISTLGTTVTVWEGQ